MDNNDGNKDLLSLTKLKWREAALIIDEKKVDFVSGEYWRNKREDFEQLQLFYTIFSNPTLLQPNIFLFSEVG